MQVSAKGKLRWFGLDLGDIPQKIVLQCASIYQTVAKDTVGVSANGLGKKARGVRSKIARRQRVPVALWEKYRHSLPGEPPRKLSGFGQSNIQIKPFRQNKRSGYRVGLFRNAIYMAYLDMGVRPGGGRFGHGRYGIAPRPWVVPSLRRAIPRMRYVAGQYGGTVR